MLINLLKLARSCDVKQNIKHISEDIERRRTACKTFQHASMSFGVLLSPEDDLVFGEESSIDIMLMKRNLVLRVAETATGCSAASLQKRF